MNTVTLAGKALVPSKIVCVGRNYVEHITELGNEFPEEMVVFNKPNSAISTELISFHQEQLHYEAELCFLYQGGKFVAVGFGLDLTKRDLQNKLKAKGLPWERAKAFDGSAVFSHFVAINPADIESVQHELTLTLLINGEKIQQGGVSLMMYKPAEILTELTSFMSLNDNDIVMTGTPKGVGKIHMNDVFSAKVKQGDAVILNTSWQVKR
ncbi:MAG: fumarylacetoacetate hydrolase family protein [Thalassotalea sp.]